MRVRFDAAAIDRYKAAGRAAWDRGETELVAGPYTFSVKRCERRGVFVLDNADVSILIDLKQHPRADDAGGAARPVGWTVTIDARAMFLARHTPLAAYTAMRAVVDELGAVEEERLRRIDLATDWSWWLIRESDAMHFRKPSGPARVAEWVDVDEDGSLATARYHRGTRLTGVSICPGGDLMFRIYNKTEHLRVMRKAEATETENEIWSSSGYVAERDGDVTRAEFQLRTGVLAEVHEFDALNPWTAIANLNALWRYCVEKWCALTLGDDERKSRCTLDPRWCEAQAVSFGQHQPIPRRLRVREGATAEQFLGCGLSKGAAAGVIINDARLDLAGEVARWQSMPDRNRADALRAEMTRAMAAATDVAITQYIANKGDALNAAEHWAHRKRAAVARHATILRCDSTRRDVAA